MNPVGKKSCFIDIHCHILPGMDDGPPLMEISLSMASMAADDGIRAIIATPHTDGIRVNREVVTPAVNRLNRELLRADIPVQVLAGFEIPSHLSNELAPTHTLGDSSYVLIEFPADFLPGDATSTIYRLIADGLRPVIAHPERNLGILANPARLGDLIDAGAQAQLTASSITGDLGPNVQQCAFYLLRKGMAHYIATDSHSPSFREPVLSRAHAITTKLIGEKQADLLTMRNPSRIVGPDLAPHFPSPSAG